MNKILASEEEMIIFKRILDIKEDMPLEICEAGQNILRNSFIYAILVLQNRFRNFIKEIKRAL